MEHRRLPYEQVYEYEEYAKSQQCADHRSRCGEHDSLKDNALAELFPCHAYAPEHHQLAASVENAGVDAVYHGEYSHKPYGYEEDEDYLDDSLYELLQTCSHHVKIFNIAECDFLSELIHRSLSLFVVFHAVYSQADMVILGVSRCFFQWDDQVV